MEWNGMEWNGSTIQFGMQVAIRLHFCLHCPSIILLLTFENARVHPLGFLKSQEVRNEDANMTSRGNSCVFPHTRAIAGSLLRNQ